MVVIGEIEVVEGLKVVVEREVVIGLKVVVELEGIVVDEKNEVGTVDVVVEFNLN